MPNEEDCDSVSALSCKPSDPLGKRRSSSSSSLQSSCSCTSACSCRPRTMSRQRSLREVSSVAGSSTGYLKQLASSISTEHLDLFIPEFVKRSSSSLSAVGGSEATAKDTVLSTWMDKVTVYHRDAKGIARVGRESVVMCLGYTDGFQVWDVSEETVVKEVACCRGIGPVWICKVLSDPGNSTHAGSSNGEDTVKEKKDVKNFAKKLRYSRPLLALVNAQDENTAPNVVSLYSLRTHKKVHKLSFESKVLKIESNDKIVAVGLANKVHGFLADTLEQKFVVDCFPCPIPDACTFALGSRWIAYPGTRAVVGSVYDVNTAESTATAGNGGEDAWVRSITTVAKDLAAGIYYLGDLGIKKLEESRRTGKEDSNDHRSQIEPQASRSNQQNGNKPPSSKSQQQKSLRQRDGVGTIVVQDFTNNIIVANFQSHQSPLLHLAFDPTGALLVSSSLEGQILKVHQILPRNPNELSSGMATRSHRLLYRLNRGYTRAAIRHVSFSNDLRWLAATSARGTTHIFAISPHGGNANSFTHPVQVIGSSSASSFSSSPLSSSRSEDGWGIRERFMSLSSSLTGASPPTSTSTGSSSLSTSLGSTSSFAGLMEFSSASSGRLNNRSRSQRSVAPIPSLVYANGKEETVNVNALARVRQKLHARPLFVPGVKDDDEVSSEPDPKVEEARKLAQLLANIPVPVCSMFRGSFLTLMSSGGVMEQFELVPMMSEKDQRELQLLTLPTKCWDVCRRMNWSDCKPQITQTTLYPPSHGQQQQSTDSCSPEQKGDQGDDDKRRAGWLSNVEIHTHAQPLTHIWAAPQFRFATFDDDSQESSSAQPDSISWTPIVVRGAGPTPMFSGGEEDVTPLHDLQDAIATPARFQDLYIADDNEIDQHVLVFDDDMHQEQTGVFTSEDFDDDELFEEDGFIMPRKV